MKVIVAAAAALFLSTAGAAAGMLPGTTWYWQLTGTVNQTYSAAKMYDIDMEEASPQLIASLQAKGHVVVCYISVGDWEQWRSDASSFPDAVIGHAVDGWAGERYIDIRSPVVLQIMTARMKTAKSKNCDGIEPDLDDTYKPGTNTGFPLTYEDQRSYDSALISVAHSLGLMIGLKNGAGTPLIADLIGGWDFAIVEQCQQYNECGSFLPFIAAGKPVFEAEYSKNTSDKCAPAKTQRFSLAFFNIALNGRRYIPC